MAGEWPRGELALEIEKIASGSFLRLEAPHVRGSGHVVRSLEAALWAFARSTTFADGALLAVNLGDDADTTGAIYGQIAGAFYGVQSIPPHWRAQLTALQTIESFAEGLVK